MMDLLELWGAKERGLRLLKVVIQLPMQIVEFWNWNPKKAYLKLKYVGTVDAKQQRRLQFFAKLGS
jgi:hypothetical protein